ncbi:MAG: hypothetical protein ACTHMM_17735 [Agriterribacter sp.]
MKIAFKLIAFAIAFIVPLLVFQTFDWGFMLIEQKKWVAFLHIPLTAFLFTAAVNWSVKDSTKSIRYKVYDKGTERFKTVWNPFWGWFIVTAVIQIAMTILFE